MATLIEQNNRNAKEKLPDPKTALIRIVGEFLHMRGTMLEEASFKCTREILGKEEQGLFSRLFILMHGQFSKSSQRKPIEQLSEDLGFPLNGVLEFLISFEKKDSILARVAVENLMDELFVKMECPPQKQGLLETSKKNVLALYSLVHGRSVSGETMNEMLSAFAYSR